MVEFIQKGDVLNFTATASVNVGDVIALGSRIGVAGDNIAKGATGSVHVVGVFKFPLKSGESDITVGKAVYWDGSAITATASTNTPAGYVFAVYDDNTVAVKIG